MNYTYMVRCRDGTLYTGWTTDLEKRLKAHNTGIGGAKYTKGRRPVELVYYEVFPEKKEAMRREYEIKQLTRKEKLMLCAKGVPPLPEAESTCNTANQPEAESTCNTANQPELESTGNTVPK